MIYFTVIKLVFFNVNYPQNHVFRQLKNLKKKQKIILNGIKIKIIIIFIAKMENKLDY